MPHPARADLRFRSMDDILAEINRLRQSGYEQLGEWDLARIVDHIAKVMNVPFDPETWGFPWPASAIARFFIHQMVKRDRYIGIKLPAPESFQPAASVDLEAALAHLVQVMAKVQAITEPEHVLKPFGKIAMADFRGMHYLHAAHHLSFLKPKPGPAVV